MILQSPNILQIYCMILQSPNILQIYCMILQGPNEAADTDAEIERIKSEIELEQKNKQTLGGKILLDHQSDY